jgi:hypothetical protein
METTKKEMLKLLIPMDELAELLEEMGFVRASTDQPVKEEPAPTKPVEEPKANLLELVSELVGAIGADSVYLSKPGTFYYLVTAGGFIFPRGSNTTFSPKIGAKLLPPKLNASPEKGGLGVPERYELPSGYQWRTTDGDGAYYIVRSDKVTSKGPAWLQTKTEPEKNAGNSIGEASTGWELESDK